jgi:hypothetical protein
VPAGAVAPVVAGLVAEPHVAAVPEVPRCAVVGRVAAGCEAATCSDVRCREACCHAAAVERSEA